MFHYKLIELEAELLAEQQSQKGFAELGADCIGVLSFIENQIEVRLGLPVPKDWIGWLSYQRNKKALVIARGCAFKEGLFGKTLAGLNVSNGVDTIKDYQRGFDVSPPQGLDHLLLNFGGSADAPRVFLWYGENISPYKLIFQANVQDDPHNQLAEAVVEACTWILKRPKDKTLAQFLKDIASQN